MIEFPATDIQQGSISGTLTPRWSQSSLVGVPRQRSPRAFPHEYVQPSKWKRLGPSEGLVAEAPL